MPKTSKRAIQAPPTDSLDYGRKRSQWRDVLHRLTRNKLAMLGLVIVLVLVLAAVFADFVAPYDPDVQDYTNMKAYPSFAHPLGTDDVGRDTLSRIIYGGFPAGFHSVHCIRPGGGRDHRCVRRLFRRSL